MENLMDFRWLIVILVLGLIIIAIKCINQAIQKTEQFYKIRSTCWCFYQFGNGRGKCLILFHPNYNTQLHIDLMQEWLSHKLDYDKEKMFVKLFFSKERNEVITCLSFEISDIYHDAEYLNALGFIEHDLSLFREVTDENTGL